MVRRGGRRGADPAAHAALRAGGVGGRVARAHAGARALGAAPRATARQVGARLHRGTLKDEEDAATEPLLLPTLPLST